MHILRGLGLRKQLKLPAKQGRPIRSQPRVCCYGKRVVAMSRSDEGLQRVFLDFREEAKRKAGIRLQDLLSGVGDGEEEMLNSVLLEQPAASKTLLTASASGMIVAGCVGVCMLCGNDPAGGARLSVDSLGAGLVGMAAAIPVVALRQYIWDSKESQQSPVIEELISRKAEELAPIVAGLSTPQKTAVIVADAVTILALMLVALMGCIDSSLTLYFHFAEEHLGFQLPELLPFLVALMVSSALYGIGQFGGTSVSADELSVVMDAIDNADRYYRVVAVDEGHNEDPEQYSVAFKKVAGNWLSNNQAAASLSGVIGFFDILFLGVLWQVTGDLTAPAVVATLGSAADYIHAHRYSTSGSKKG